MTKNTNCVNYIKNLEGKSFDIWSHPMIKKYLLNTYRVLYSFSNRKMIEP